MITLDGVKVVDSNIYNIYNFTSFDLVNVEPSSFSFKLINSVFSKYTSNRPWMSFYMLRDLAPHTFTFSKIDVDNL
jgi:hypothetical protein